MKFFKAIVIVLPMQIKNFIDFAQTIPKINEEANAYKRIDSLKKVRLLSGISFPGLAHAHISQKTLQ
jgi:hypothetical protein